MLHTVYCHIAKCRVIADKNAGKHSCGKNRNHHKRYAADCVYTQTFPQYVFKLSVVLCAVVKAGDGCTANRIAPKNGDKEKGDIAYGAVCGNTILADETQELEIIKHNNNRSRRVYHKFR